MSQYLIQQYLNQLSDLRIVSGSSRESVVREAFKDLLKGWARSHDLIFIPEYEIQTPAKERRYVDGALLYTLRVPFGYWEAKDEKDDLDAEIEIKFKRGYPQDNIIFEDSQQAALIQNKREVMRCKVDDVEKLEKLLNLFFAYQRPEIAAFRKAVEQFKIDLPAVLKSLREMIEAAEKANKGFSKASDEFLNHVKDVINPTLTAADVREMLIQHVLTEELFVSVFPGSSFHRDNNIARELYKLEATFFTGNTKFKTLKALEPYYAAIRAAAAQISSHHEKQTFLKVIYENFYKVYNPKAADRLGVVYTPNEIVRFMVDSTDWLCEKHFGRNLIDKDVDILDPAAGTGTFICEILEHFRGSKVKLRQKYQQELHANEVAILPYYVANLNIEATYAAIAGSYEEFPGLCFVDTLDNTFALRKHKGHQEDLFGISDANIKRIRQQNSRRISVIIGNPPYNANQANENDNNKNREYAEIDKRIKETYIKASTAQKTKQYDMFVRFFRWASDRVDENGVVAFITNRSFIDKFNFDGFRKVVSKEFNYIYVIDLGGDWKIKGAGGGGNVFGIGTGVAISFLIKIKGEPPPAKIKLYRPSVSEADEKLAWLESNRFSDLRGDDIKPDVHGYWIDQAGEDDEETLPIASKTAKAAKVMSQAHAVFKIFSLGISTNRDEWLYDLDDASLAKKVQFLINHYNQILPTTSKYPNVIKWSRNLKRRLSQNRREKFAPHQMVEANYRPYIKAHFYQSPLFVDEMSLTEEIFPVDSPNVAICFTDPHGQKPWFACAINRPADLHFVGSGAGTICLARYSYVDNERTENITDWALKQFVKHYQDKKITKESIFYYVYGVLHDPVYREKYALNLKRDFPRVPFYKDFRQWADWGKKLMDLHIGYEAVRPYKLQKLEVPIKKDSKPECKLKTNKDADIVLDTKTTLTGIPKEAWDYKLGNRSALEWILDQYKESKPKDPTIREKFNTYRFADYKDHVIDLLARVTRVSVETMQIIDQMRKSVRGK